MDTESSVGLAALQMSLSILRALVVRRLVTIEEVDEIYSSAFEVPRHTSPEVAETIEDRLHRQFAEIRELAIGEQQ